MKKILLSASGFAFLLASCGGSGEGESENTDTNAVEIEVVEVEEVEEFGVPSPTEIFDLFTDFEGKTVQTFNHPDNIDRYLTNDVKALNLGIYLSDFGFASKVNESKDAWNYLNAGLDLLKGIGAEEVVDFEAIASMASAFEDGEDSVVVTMDKTFANMFNKLEKNGYGSELSLIMIGGWVEGVYLLAELDFYSKESLVVQAISEQSYTLDQIMGFTSAYANDESVAQWRNKMMELQEIYKKMDVHVEETQVRSEDGTMVFEGGESVILNETDYYQLIEKVSKIRSKIIGG